MPLSDPGSHTLRSAAVGSAVAWMPEGVERLVEGQPVRAWVDPARLRGQTLKVLETLPPAWGFTGDSGSGKTTLIVCLLERLRSRGLRVGTLKHATHELSLDVPGKDSFRHREAGASRVAVVGPGQRALFVTEEEPPTLTGMLEAFAGHVDLVLVEGFRDLPMPRVHLEVTGEGCSLERDEEVIGPPLWRLQNTADGEVSEPVLEQLVTLMCEGDQAL